MKEKYALIFVFVAFFSVVAETMACFDDSIEPDISENIVEIVYDIAGRKIVPDSKHPTLPFIGTTEKDFVNIKLINIKQDELKDNDFQIVEISRKSLGEPIRVIGDINAVARMSYNRPGVLGEHENVALEFPLGRLEGGLKYKFLIQKKNKTGEPNIEIGQFTMEVDEIVYVHVRLGHIFTTIAKQHFKIVPSDINETSFKIERSLSTGEGLLISGASFHPWGYNPRRYNFLHNIGFMIGVPFNKPVGESFFAGMNWGGKGLYLTLGANWAKVDKLIDAFDGKTFPTRSLDVNEVTTETWEIGVFGGVWFDINIVPKVLPLNRND